MNKMSAYDWVECPVCKDKLVKLEQRLINERQTLSDKDYETLFNEREILKNSLSDNKETVRQDQEIWLDDKTMCLKGYVGMSCEVCGSEWDVKFSVNKKQ